MTGPRHGWLDEVDGRLLCHECARTYLHLATHVRLAHGMSAAEYREAHGIGAATPLVGSSLSEGASERARRPESLAHLAVVRDVDKLAASRGVASMRPDALRRQADPNRARAVVVPGEVIAALPAWESMDEWCQAVHALVAEGYPKHAIARALGRHPATVDDRLRRHPQA